MPAPYSKGNSDLDSGLGGLTNREIGKIVGTSEQVINNHLRSAFDKLGVWSRLELAMYVASHGGKDWPPEAERPGMPYRQAVGAD